MRAICIRAASMALGRAITKGEADEIERRIMQGMRFLASKDPTWANKTITEQVSESAKKAAQEVVEEKRLKQHRDALNILAQSRLALFINQAPARGLSRLDALDRTVAFHADGNANTTSIESWANAIGADYVRQIITTLEASNPKFFGLFENAEGIRDLTMELFGENSGNADARAGAKVYHDVAETARQRFNRAGGAISKLEDWKIPHHHSQTKVAAAKRDPWITEIMPGLNRNKYFNEDGSRMDDGQLGNFLSHAWESIATGGANKLTPGVPRGTGARANRGSEHRQIHFKDADSYMRYQAKFGESDPYSVIVNHLLGISKDIALVEIYGPNPDRNFHIFLDTEIQKATLADPESTGDLRKRAIKIENLYNEVAGIRVPIASLRMAQTFDTLRSWLVAARLGSAVITSFSDEATMHLTGHINNLPEMQLLKNELAAYNRANKLEERLANRQGLGLTTMISVLNRFGQEGLGKSFSSKLASATIRASGLNAMTEARKRGFGVTMMGAIGRVVRDNADLAALSKTDHAILLSKGVTDTEFAIWKNADAEDWGNGNDTMLTPDAIYRMSDVTLNAIDPGVHPQQLREQAATRLLAAILEETNVAVVEPGARERSQMLSHLQRGTLKGEVTRSFFLFKSFPLAMIERHWNRGMAMETKGGRAAYLATLMAATTVLGAMSLEVNEIVSGRDPKELFGGKHWKKDWLAAMLKGGSMGVYGDYLFSNSSQYGNSPLATLTGPVLGMAEDFMNLTQGNIVQFLNGKKTDAGAEFIRFTKSNLPGASLWYGKAALDHLIFHRLQEYFSPGYLARMRTRAQREFNQRFWWEPGETKPDRAPDLTAVGGN